LFDHRGRPLDDFAGRDLVDQLSRENPNAPHAVKLRLHCAASKPMSTLPVPGSPVAGTARLLLERIASNVGTVVLGKPQQIRLPAPFTVIATQNPIDLSGTYPLPDSQLDRFLMRLSLGHLPAEVESQLLQARRTDPLASLPSVASKEDLVSIAEAADRVRVDPAIADYAVRLASATREHAEIERGASIRAVLSLMAAARAWALWDERDFVSPGDIRTV